jgi:hypothetical protein
MLSAGDIKVYTAPAVTASLGRYSIRTMCDIGGDMEVGNIRQDNSGYGYVRYYTVTARDGSIICSALATHIIPIVRTCRCDMYSTNNKVLRYKSSRH